MNEYLQELLIALVAAGVPAVWAALVNSRWWAQSVPWIGKKVAAIVAYAVARTFRDYVDDLMAQKALAGDSMDLKPHEARQAMELAEKHVVVAAEKIGLTKAIPAPPVLQGMIQQEVVRQKAVKRPVPLRNGKGFS